MQCAQICILFDADKVCFRSLLGGKDGGSLGAKLFIASKRDLADETLEGSFWDEQFCRLLEAADLAKSDSAGAVAVGLLDAAGLGAAGAGPEAFATGGGGDSGGSSNMILPGCLATVGLACSPFLCSDHDVMILVHL